MECIVLDKIPFCIDEEGMKDILHVRRGSRNEAEFSALFKEASGIAAPKAVYGVTETCARTDNIVAIGDVEFQSRLLCANTTSAGTIFPFAATCGIELEEWSGGLHSALHSFWADTIMLLAMGFAVNHLEACLKEKTGKDTLSSMNPGSLKEWPIEEQENLFALLGESASAIGVRLTKSMCIRPLKSISGIYFVSEKGFCNCTLCPRERCITRRAPYKEAKDVNIV